MSARQSARAVGACDAVVVGAGLTGTWAAKQLGEAGMRVMLLDAGPLPSSSAATERGDWSIQQREAIAARQPVQARHFSYWQHDPALFVDDIDHPYSYASGSPFVWIRGRQVGGRSHTWGGVTLRFSDCEFKDREAARCGGHWPLGYADLAPYYDTVERVFAVQGSSANLMQLPDGAFMPPIALTQSERLFKRVIEHRWPERHVIHSRSVSGAVHHDGWAPRTTLHALLPSALATSRVTLRPDSIVSHLVLGSDLTTVRGVAGKDRLSGQSFEVSARIVVLCASTLESLRIMLNSRSRHCPDGVGNSRGLLGTRLLDHAAVSLSGSIPNSEDFAVEPWTPGAGILIPRFCNVGRRDRKFVGGYGVSGGLQRGSRSAKGEAPWSLTALLEVLPRVENAVRIDDRLVDAWGIPSVSVQMSYSNNEREMQHEAEQCLREMADSAGLLVQQTTTTLPGAYVHELGGAPIGNDPGSSVLNPCNACWDAKNLFVLDGACFVTAGWQNPSLTMMALAVRASAYIAAEFWSGHL